ncbi:MAG: sn-glycerol-3-phosphate ABC transporter ATP-binding protein UgpC [Clostridiales bacterium]|nr:sn-glycerol-3-phosphate ABC transporter ATP-binding protein UgpC [Clostridiales bacterium]
MASVTLKGVKKIYDNKVVAVHDFNLQIKDKEFVVFVGPSGCGKSTTLRMIAGLEDISEGTLRIGDRVVNDVEPKDRDIAMVFQNYALYPHISVYENMAFPLRIRKMNNEEIHRRVCQAAEILGITEYLTRKPKALSGGQRQRVAIGRAIVREPAVFLMDEPLSNLDAKLRNQMRAEIILLRKRLDTTFIYVTHDQTEAMTLGDRIVIMKDGFIQQVGTPQEVFDTPKNLFVAGFIGAPQMNFIPARLNAQNGYTVDVLGTRVELTGAKAQILGRKNIQSQDVLLGVRPEHTTVCFDKNEGAIESTILVNEMMGSELHLHVTTDGKNKIILRLPTIDLTDAQRASLVSGNKLYFTFASKVVHLFDPKTEESLLFEEIKTKA